MNPFDWEIVAQDYLLVHMESFISKRREKQGQYIESHSHRNIHVRCFVAYYSELKTQIWKHALQGSNKVARDDGKQKVK